MYYTDPAENVAANVAQKWSSVLEALDTGVGDPEWRRIYHNMTVDGSINVEFKLKACM